MQKFLFGIVGVCAGAFVMAGTVLAAPITIDFTGAVDFFNPGPFTQEAPLSGQITLDDTVVPFGPNNTFNNVITGFSLTISEPGGPVTYTNNGTGGRVQQFTGAGGVGEFITIAFGGGAGGVFTSPAGEPLMTSFNFDLRGTDLFADPTVLATGLTEADLTNSRANFFFNVNGLSQLMVERALDTVTFSGERQTAAVSAPGAPLILAIGLFGLAAAIRRHR